MAMSKKAAASSRIESSEVDGKLGQRPRQGAETAISTSGDHEANSPPPFGSTAARNKTCVPAWRLHKGTGRRISVCSRTLILA